MRLLIALVASLLFLSLAACDSRTDRVACEQYADTISSLDCDPGAADGIRTFCAAEPVDPCADPDSSECVTFWDCVSQRASCDPDERFRVNEICVLSTELERQEEIRFD